MTPSIEVEYCASVTCSKFHRSDASVRALMGPIGSGKSVACCWEVFRRCQEQEQGPDGYRKSRWVIIRNSYRELQDTTIKTWLDWFPKELGTWKESDMTQTIEFNDIKAEILFRSLDKPADIKKLLSLELTGGFVNEAREIPFAVIKMLRGRVGRYPSKRDGGATWYGVIMDTNPPDEDHWWYRIFEEEKPDGWELFKQPSGESEEAENLDNLPATYYRDMQQGADKEWIGVYVHGRYGFISDGKPIFPEYQDHIHAANENIPVVKTETVYVGIDFGLTPAAAFIQDINGQLRVIDELVTEDMGAKRFGKELKRRIARDYQGLDLEFIGDPAGEQRAQTDEDTPFNILHALGVEAYPANTNDFTIRREAVATRMTELTMTGSPAFLVSPKAKMIRKGLGGGYRYKRIQVSGDERFQDKPDKNAYSHPCEGLQYGCLGAGLGNEVIGGDSWGEDINYGKLGYA